MEYNLDPGDLDGTLPADGAWAAAEGGNVCGPFRSTIAETAYFYVHADVTCVSYATCCCRRPLKGDIQTLHDVLQERKASLGKNVTCVDWYYVNLITARTPNASFFLPLSCVSATEQHRSTASNCHCRQRLPIRLVLKVDGVFGLGDDKRRLKLSLSG